MTTTPTLSELFSPMSYAEDPSGTELRRALLTVPQPRRRDTASVVLAGTAGAVLVGGILRLLLV